jgi:hypothetical protein
MDETFVSRRVLSRKFREFLETPRNTHARHRTKKKQRDMQEKLTSNTESEQAEKINFERRNAATN